jgi:predicted RNase H-like HicB family nuclease
MKLKVILQQDEDGRYNASCPELKGCHSFGDTVEDALNNLREAVELYLEDVPQDEISEHLLKIEFMEIAV